MAAEPFPPPLKLRPDRRNVALVAAVVAAGPALAVLGWQSKNSPATIVGAFAAVFFLRNEVLMLRSRTVAWPDGLYNRLTLRTAEIAWTNADRLIVVPTLFGRFVQLVETDGSRFTLAAPRRGLLARGARFDEELAMLRRVPTARSDALRVERQSRFPIVATQAIMLIAAVAIIIAAYLLK